jgi:hypothetical protein
MSKPGNSGRLCRDENCDRTGLHLEHEVKPKIVDDKSKSSLEPWKRPAPKALDHSIAKATSRVYPRPFDMIMREVERDYGSCCSRTVQRHLQQLVARGHILRIDLGRRLHAYLRPGSNMINDIELLRTQIHDQQIEAAQATASATA